MSGRGNQASKHDYAHGDDWRICAYHQDSYGLDFDLKDSGLITDGLAC